MKFSLPTALLTGAIALTLVYFFGFVKIFGNGHISTATWAWQAWTPETNYEHGPLIPLISAFLIWYKRDKLRAAPIGSSKWGWLFIGVGIFLFFAGVRTLQGRIALTAFPIILFGVVLYGWGRDVARIVLFPIAFLLFMVPAQFSHASDDEIAIHRNECRLRDMQSAGTRCLRGWNNNQRV